MVIQVRPWRIIMLIEEFNNFTDLDPKIIIIENECINLSKVLSWKADDTKSIIRITYDTHENKTIRFGTIEEFREGRLLLSRSMIQLEDYNG